MYPEAGGSASFARRAFNEFWSFFAAWAQMLTYICTIAISAFFVPHYIGGLFWEPLRHGPGDIIVGAFVIVLLAGINIFGVKESTGVNVLLARHRLHDPAAAGGRRRRAGALAGGARRTTSTSASRPTWKDFILAIPIGMLAYTGIETISNMSEEARDEAKTIPAAINRVRIAVFAIYFTLPAVALSALPVQQRADGTYYTLLGLPGGRGRLRRRPDPRLRQADRPRAAAGGGRALRRPAGGDDPVPRHQRGHHRRLAARLLDGHPPPDARRAAAAAPALPHALDRHPRLLRPGDPDPAPRPGGLPGQHLLLRRAAVVHDGPRGRDPAAAEAAGLPALLPRAGQPPDRRLRRAAVRDRRAAASRRSRSS